MVGCTVSACRRSGPRLGSASEFTSLRGETYIREVDHQASVPSYIGQRTLDPDRGFYVYSELETVPAEEIWLPEDEVASLQPGA